MLVLAKAPHIEFLNSTNFAYDVLKISRVFVQNFDKFYLKFSQTLPKIYSEFSKNFPKFS